MAPQPLTPERSAVVRGLAGDWLRRNPSFARLDPATRGSLEQSISEIASAFAAEPDLARRVLAGQLAPPNLDAIRRGGAGAPAASSPPVGGTTAPAAGGSPAPGGTATPPAAGGPTGRVGEVARATLNAIDFPSFVAALIQGTFRAIVDASIEQMRAYAELLRNVAGSLDRFMSENVPDSTARDFLADQYGDVVSRDTRNGSPRLVVNRDTESDELPPFFADLGFSSRDDLDDDSVEETLVPAARRSLAEQKLQTLATMVLLGINRIVVDDGEISAKLQFHIDAREQMQIRFNQQNTTNFAIAKGGGTPFSAQGIMVNTASLNAQTDLNVRADLTGAVKVHFRSETFPLERFADSAAIQLINQNARVPQPAAALPGGSTGAAPAGGAPAVAPATTAQPAAAPTAAVPPAAAPPVAAPPVAVPPAVTPAAQSLAMTPDPWAPLAGVP